MKRRLTPASATNAAVFVVPPRRAFSFISRRFRTGEEGVSMIGAAAGKERGAGGGGEQVNGKSRAPGVIRATCEFTSANARLRARYYNILTSQSRLHSVDNIDCRLIDIIDRPRTRTGLNTRRTCAFQCADSRNRTEDLTAFTPFLLLHVSVPQERRGSEVRILSRWMRNKRKNATASSKIIFYAFLPRDGRFASRSRTTNKSTLRNAANVDRSTTAQLVKRMQREPDTHISPPKLRCGP